jgi:hypothetical protein
VAAKTCHEHPYSLKEIVIGFSSMWDSSNWYANNVASIMWATSFLPINVNHIDNLLHIYLW